MKDLEDVTPPKIGGTLPHDAYIRALYSIGKSLKRIADALDQSIGGKESIATLAVQAAIDAPYDTNDDFAEVRQDERARIAAALHLKAKS